MFKNTDLWYWKTSMIPPFTRRLKVEPDKEFQLYEQAVNVLLTWNKNVTETCFDDCYDKHILITELTPFFTVWYFGAKHVGKSQTEFIDKWRNILDNMPTTKEYLVLRDNHLDNTMTMPDNKTCGVLDFQNAVWGSSTYHFISLVEDAQRDSNDG